MKRKAHAIVNSSTVSSTELNSIRLDALSISGNAKRTKKEILHQKSNERAAKWGNTIEALREEKQRQKIIKREEEEAQLRKLDEVEEKIRQEQREKMRERAKVCKQEQSDEIRKFKSKLMMADIVHQREQQLNIKKYQQSMDKELEQKYLQQTLHTMKVFDDKENEKSKIIKQKQLETKLIIATQLKEVEARKEMEQLEQTAAAKYLIGIAKEEERKSIRREEERVAHIKKIQCEQALWLKEQMKQKQLENAKIKHEDAEIAQYAAEKDRVEHIRKEKEIQRFAEKQKIRQKLIDSQTAYLENLRLNEDDRVAKQVMESERKKEQMEAQKVEKQEKLLKECLAQCEFQQNKKKEIKVKELSADKVRLDAINQDVKRYQEEEEQNVVQRKMDAIKVQKFLRKQMMDKKKREIELAESDTLHQNKITKEFADEQKEISQWAQQKIKEYEAMGLDVKHLFKM